MPDAIPPGFMPFAPGVPIALLYMFIWLAAMAFAFCCAPLAAAGLNIPATIDFFRALVFWAVCCARACCAGGVEPPTACCGACATCWAGAGAPLSSALVFTSR